jgi:hypothetical protein
MRLFLMAAAALFMGAVSCVGALAQGSVGQAGPVIVGDGACWVQNGYIMDCGTAAGGGPGVGLGQFLEQTRSRSQAPAQNNGFGQGPFQNVGPGIFGTNSCDYAGSPQSPAGSYYLCWDPDTVAGGTAGGVLAYGTVGVAPPLPFQICVNGQCLQIPFTGQGGGNVVGLSPSVVNQGVCFQNTIGTLIGTCAGIDTNTLNVQTTNYTIQTSDCGKTVQMGNGSGGQLTVTLPAATSLSFATSCSITVKNADTTHGKVLVGFPAGMTAQGLLMPLQGVTVKVINNQWEVITNPGRWKAPLNTVLYVDINNGNDNNDCLSAGTACLTNNFAFRTYIKDYMDLTGDSSFGAPNPSGSANVFVQLVDNGSGGVPSGPCFDLVHLAFDGVGREGRAGIVLQGNASAPGNTIICSASGANIGVYNNGTLEVRNLTIGIAGASSSSYNGFEAADSSTIRLEGGVTINSVITSMFSVYDNSVISLDSAGLTLAGSAGFAVEVHEGGVMNFNEFAVAISGTNTFSQAFFGIEGWGEINATAVTWSGPNPTGQKYQCNGVGFISTGTGNGASIPGTLIQNPSPGCQIDKLAGVQTNNPNVQTASYSDLPSDCGNTVIMSGGPFFNSLPAVSGFSTSCTIRVCNANANTSGQPGINLIGFPAPSLRHLYPQQCESVGVENGVWQAIDLPGRFRPQFTPTLYVDNAGNDNNDGLQPNSAGEAIQTEARCILLMQTEYDMGTQQPVCSFTGGQTFVAGVEITGPFVGTSVINFAGNGGVATLQTPAGIGATALFLSDFSPYVITSNITYSCVGGAAECFGIYMHQQTGVDLNAGTTIIGGGTQNVGINCDSACKVNQGADASGPMTLGGTFDVGIGGSLASVFAFNGGVNLANGTTVTTVVFSATRMSTMSYTGAINAGTGVTVGEVFQVDGNSTACIAALTTTGSFTGARQFQALNNSSLINTSATAIPGTVTGVTTTTGYAPGFAPDGTGGNTGVNARSC